MPLLLVAILTHIVYKAISNGLDWGSEASRRAWGASLAHSQSMADRLRQQMTDTLDSWDQDPRGRRYAATGVRMALGTARLLGKIGLGTVLGAVKGAGAVSRVLAGGALATGGLLGALARATRLGVRDGSQWWRNNHSSRKWKWLNWFRGRAEQAAKSWWQWGNTIPGEGGPSSGGDEPSYPEPEPQGRRYGPDEYPEPTYEEPQEGPRTQPTPDPQDPFDQNEQPWSWTPPQPEPEPQPQPQPEAERPPRRVVVEWGEPIDENGGKPTTVDPTPVHSESAGLPAASGTATAILDRPASPELEGGTMGSDLLPASGGTVAPISNAADGMQYEQALAFLAQQEQRAQHLAALAEQIHSLQMQLMSAAEIMGGDHAAAEAALSRFGVQAPNVAEAIGLLHSVASPAPAEQMITTYMALDAVSSGCAADATDLVTRFGSAWETTKAEQIDGQFYNG